MKKILIVAAHPDDEVLGCGGAIAKHTQAGDEVHILFMADGVTSRTYDPKNKITRVKELQFNKKAIDKRNVESLAAAELLGVKAKHVYRLELPDQRLDTYSLLDLVKMVEEYKAIVKPQIVYTHFWNDLNVDHCLTSRAVATAFGRRQDERNILIYQFEVPESTELSIPDGKEAFVPDHFMDISSTIELKLKALNIYESEKREYPDRRSAKFIKELAQRHGGISSNKFVEAFYQLKRS